MQNTCIKKSIAATFIRFALALAFSAALLSAQGLTCPATNPPANLDFHGKTLREASFNEQDLTGASFAGAILEAPIFTGAILTGANFGGATFTNGASNPELVADFTSANLQGACFIHAQFNGTTYFTQATLTCADFSNVDLTNGNAVFGEDPLTIDRTRTDCRLAFRNSTMSCEFLPDWQYLNLNGAIIKACLSNLAGQNFSGAQMEGVQFDGATLDGANFTKADLSRAILNNSSLQNANFTSAQLFGTQLNNADLSGATFYSALLSNDNGKQITDAASLVQSHMKNVNFSSATLSGVDFTNANFYGDNTLGTGTCKIAATRAACTTTSRLRRKPPSRRRVGVDSYAGFACGCAAAHNATLDDTKFINTYLAGVDFTGASGKGTNFFQSVLVGANFAGAQFGADPDSASNLNFSLALLEGANLTGANITDNNNLTSLKDAFVDFTNGGNTLYVLLSGRNHNNFGCLKCNPAHGADVCIALNYGNPTVTPGKGLNVTCPNGSVGDCGPADPTGKNKNWESTIADFGIPPNVPLAWYDSNSTFMNAPVNTNVVCGGKGEDASLLIW